VIIGQLEKHAWMLSAESRVPLSIQQLDCGTSSLDPVSSGGDDSQKPLPRRCCVRWSAALTGRGKGPWPGACRAPGASERAGARLPGWDRPGVPAAATGPGPGRERAGTGAGRSRLGPGNKAGGRARRASQKGG
jgi:hypothetical protein